MSNIQQFIDLIGQGQNAQAQESLNDILSAKAFEALETYKHSIGANLFGVNEALSNPNDKNWAPVGEFREKDYNKHFEYSKAPEDSWGAKHGLPHVVHLTNNEKRAAHVKGTVAHVATDEDEHGKPVIQKWNIKNHNKYNIRT